MVRIFFMAVRLISAILFATRTCSAFNSPIVSPTAVCGPAAGLCYRPAALSLKRISIKGGGGGGGGAGRGTGHPASSSTNQVRMAASKSWGTRDWNWGYASGGAHDAAAVLRARLSKGEAREEVRWPPPPLLLLPCCTARAPVAPGIQSDPTIHGKC